MKGSVTVSDRPGHVWPDLYFLEPNLAFSVASREEGLVGVRLHLSLESAPTGRDDPEHFDIYQYFLDLPMSATQLEHAATCWLVELERYPVRST